ncbi:hypothetical protein SRHO_G00098500 [Serrasalmus rhombeus]
MLLLQNWCKGEGVDPNHALVVSQVPEGTETGDIEKALEHIKALGRVRVRGRLFEPQTQSLVVLCECKGEVSAPCVPREIHLLEGGSPWALSGPDDVTPVVMATKDTPPDTPEPVPSPLEDHPYSEPAQSAPQSSIPMETFFKVVETLIEKSAKPSYDSHVFIRLRAFSGLVPTPAGEESLDIWLEQARLMTESTMASQRTYTAKEVLAILTNEDSCESDGGEELSRTYEITSDSSDEDTSCASDEVIQSPPRKRQTTSAPSIRAKDGTVWEKVDITRTRVSCLPNSTFSEPAGPTEHAKV